MADWAEALNKRQADAIRDLGWSRSSASDLWTGKQRYTQDHVDEVCRWLGLDPYEILLHPREARALRQMREMALTIAAEEERHDHGAAAEVTPRPGTGRTGTRG